METIKEVNDILLLLKGEIDNGFVCIYADLPIDANKVINHFKQDIVNDVVFRANLLSALKLLADDKDFSWFVLYYISSLLWLLRYNDFQFDVIGFIDYFNACLIKHESHYKTIKKWGGANYENGLWGDVERMSKNIFEEFGVKILP